MEASPVVTLTQSPEYVPGEAGPYGVKVPQLRAVEKYGWTLLDWALQIERQKGLCPICGKQSSRMVIDHEHTKGYRKLPSEQRRRYVRGIVCWFCNLYYLCRSMTAEKAARLIVYLQRHRDGFASLPDEIIKARAAYLLEYEAARSRVHGQRDEYQSTVTQSE